MNGLIAVAVVRFAIAAVARNGRAPRGRRIGAFLLGLVAALGTLARIATLAVAAPRYADAVIVIPPRAF